MFLFCWNEFLLAITLTSTLRARTAPAAMAFFTGNSAFAVPTGLAEAYRFDPGQHLTLRTVLGGVETRRSYSICTGPDDDDLRVVVKQQEGGLFSNWINETAKVGDTIDVMTPQGRFGIRPDPGASRNYLAIAAGSGITPVMSILRSVLAREPASRIALLYGNRTAQSIIFKRELEALKDRFLARLSVHHVLSRERQELELFNGRRRCSRPHFRRIASTMRSCADPAI